MLCNPKAATKYRSAGFLDQVCATRYGWLLEDETVRLIASISTATKGRPFSGRSDLLAE
jgi:hypothetical protein